MSKENIFSGIPRPRISSEDIFDSYLLKLIETESFSDVYFHTGRRVVVKSKSYVYRLEGGPLEEAEGRFLVNLFYRGENGWGEVSRGNYFSTSYEIKKNNGERLRFRVEINASRIPGNSTGARIVLRPTDGTKFRLKDMNLPQEVIDGFRVSQGLILVAGATGAGKSTLLSAAIIDILERENANQVILEYGAPIETTYDDIDSPSCEIYQAEIGRDFHSFADALNNSRRSNPDTIVISELKGAIEIKNAITAANTGHCVMSTLHANSPGEAIRRMVSEIDDGDKKSLQADLIASIRMVIVQRPVKTIDGGIEFVRGYLVFNDEIRKELLDVETDKILPVVAKIVENHGVKVSDEVRKLYEEGKVSEAEYLYVKAGEM